LLLTDFIPLFDIKLLKFRLLVLSIDANVNAL